MFDGFINILYNRGSFTYFQSDDTRGCNNIICPPENEQDTARNMLRIIMNINIVIAASVV